MTITFLFVLIACEYFLGCKYLVALHYGTAIITISFF